MRVGEASMLENNSEHKAGVWTQIAEKERMALSLICVKRTLATGRRVTKRSLLRELIKAEIRKSIKEKEIDPSELGVFNDAP